MKISTIFFRPGIHLIFDFFWGAGAKNYLAALLLYSLLNELVSKRFYHFHRDQPPNPRYAYAIMTLPINVKLNPLLCKQTATL